MQASNGLGGWPVCRLESEQATYSTPIFGNMLAAQRLDYTFKGEPIDSYLQPLHEGLRVRRWENLTLPHPPVSGHAPHLLR